MAAAAQRLTWFDEPEEMLPTPGTILGAQRRVRRPPALAALQEPPKRPKPSRRAAEAPTLQLPDRALTAGGEPLRHGRVRLDGHVVAVPQQPSDFLEALDDPQHELLLVELAAPNGAWLDDPEVESVLVGERTVPVAAVRRLVQERVNVLGRGSQTLRGLYSMTRPKAAPEYALVLLPVADLVAAA